MPFQKGMIPWNKNLKGIHLSRKTEFQRGQKRISTLEVGTIKIRNCKNGKKRHFINGKREGRGRKINSPRRHGATHKTNLKRSRDLYRSRAFNLISPNEWLK